ncbi:pyruvate kinase [Guggenheimella bovis]
MRQTKIIGTIGPASENEALLREIFKAGLNIVRFNLSHGTHESHKKNIDLVKKLRKELDLPIGIMIDTKGPEIRFKTMKAGIVLEEGSEFILSSGDFEGDNKKACITYEGLYRDVVPGGKLLVNDGKIVLEVIQTEGKDIRTKVLHGGELTTRKALNAPGIRVKLPAVTEQDVEDILFGIKEDMDFLSPSFIRKASDVLEIRKLLEANNASHVKIIAKIENHEGVANLDEIIKVSDGIMVARGDLGMEMPIEDVPMTQKEMIRKANLAGKPVVTATQMLESMTKSPLPTRAEATDVANAILDGTDAIMLSGEMASGDYPLEAVQMMNRISLATESKLDFADLLKRTENAMHMDSVTYAISRSTVESAYNLHAKAILTATSSGFTAEKTAIHRPECPIIAGTTNERVRRQLSLFRGVHPFMMKPAYNLDTIFASLQEMGLESGLIEEGDLVILTCGVPVGVSGATNTMKVHLVGEVTLKGTGIGHKKHYGTVRFEEDKDEFMPGDVLVAQSIDESMIELVKLSGAVVTVEGGYSSLGAIAALNLDIPAVVGVEHALEKLHRGMHVTVDSSLGIIYNSVKGRL